MVYLPGLYEKIAVSLTLDLLKASAAVIRRRLSKSDTQKALQAAIAAGLKEALSMVDLDPSDRNHYESLFEEFFRREAVVAELAQLLDPRPGVELSLKVLAEEFDQAGFAPDLIPHFCLDDFLRTFASAFYAAAASETVLKGDLEMKLLGEMVARMGSVAIDAKRTAEATEQMTGLLQQFLGNQIAAVALLQAGQEARDRGMIAAFQAFEGVRTVMLKAGFDLGVDRADRIEISGSDLKALPPAQAETIRSLAGDLRQTVLERTPEPAELDALEERYRQHIIRWFENLQFQGLMRTPRPIVLPLEKVYVELRAVAEVPEAADAFSMEERRLLLDVEEKSDTGRRELMKQLDSLRRERWSRTLPERKSMAEALHQRDRRAFVILGDPGSGKTTLLHVLALVYARGPEAAAQHLKVNPTEADRLPIFVPLAAFDDMLRETPGLTLFDFLARYYDRRRGLPGLEPLFRRALSSGRALLLLDGLDEVLDTNTRNYIAQQAGALIGDLTPHGVRFAVSSRFVGYREAPVPGNLPTLSVLDFGEPEIELFVHRWAYAYEKWAAENQETPEMLARARTLESDLLLDVKSNESVRRLAANPLMITMLALLRRQVGKLPHRRIQLYESYVGALLETWIDVRTPGAHETDARTFDRFRAENLLLPLALWLQKEKPSGTASGYEIRAELTKICLTESGLTWDEASVPRRREAEKQADEFLREMRQLTGLVIERGRDAFGFLHLTFQEYFAGRALASLSDEERWKTVKAHLHDPRWREPVLLCAGRLGVVENRRPQVTVFVRSILECADPTEEKLHRNLLLALAIAGDDVNLDPTLIQEMVRRAVDCLPTWIETLLKSLVGGLGQLVANGAAEEEECFEEVLTSKNAGGRRVAVEALARFAGVEGIRGMLVERLEDVNSYVVAVALAALSSQVGTVEMVRQAVMAKLKDEDWRVRRSAVGALAGAVGADTEVLGAILERLRDSEQVVQKAAVSALTTAAKVSKEVRQSLLVQLNGESEDLRQESVLNLRLALLAKPETSDEKESLVVLPSLVVSVDSGIQADPAGRTQIDYNDWRQRLDLVDLAGESADMAERLSDLFQLCEDRRALESLAVLEGVASAAPQSLGGNQMWWTWWLDKKNSLDERERAAAMTALAASVEVDADVRRAILEGLKDESSSVRQSVLDALCKTLEWGADIQRAVLERFGDKNESEWVRISALKALHGLADKEIQEAVLDKLNEEEGAEPWSTLKAAADVGVRSKQTIWEIITGEKPSSRAAALESMASLFQADPEVRRTILKSLEDEDSRVRRSAVRVLLSFVGEDSEGREMVLKRLKDSDPRVRMEAISTLAGLFGKFSEVTAAVLDCIEDQAFQVRLSAVQMAAGGPLEVLTPVLIRRLRPWLALDADKDYFFSEDPVEPEKVRAQLASLFSFRLLSDSLLRDELFEMLLDTRWSARLGAALTLLSWPGGPSDDVLARILEALEDRRGLEAYPAQLTAASFLINQNKYAQGSIDLCLEALDYGARAWEFLPLRSEEVRQQAALVLGKLEPLYYDKRAYDKLLQVMENDKDPEVRDAAYGALVRLAWIRDGMVAVVA